MAPVAAVSAGIFYSGCQPNLAMLMPNKWYPVSTTDAVVLTHNWYVYIQGSLEFCYSNMLFTRNTSDSRIQRDSPTADATTLLVLRVWRGESTNYPGWSGTVETMNLPGQREVRRDGPAVNVNRLSQKPACSEKQETSKFSTHIPFPQSL